MSATAEIVPGSAPLSSRQMLLRDAIAESRSPRYLLSLFDLPAGEHQVKLDASISPVAGVEPNSIPHTAEVHIEAGKSDADGRWAWLCTWMRFTPEAEPLYLVITLLSDRLVGAWKADESPPTGDEDVFSSIDLVGLIPPDAVDDFLGFLSLSSRTEGAA